MPSCWLGQVVVPVSSVAAFVEPSHPASLALLRVRRTPLKRIGGAASRGIREIPRLSGGFRLDPHSGSSCRQARTQAGEGLFVWIVLDWCRDTGMMSVDGCADARPRTAPPTRRHRRRTTRD